MIIHKSLKHGWWYHYRIHDPKSRTLCCNDLSPMREYLFYAKDNCPDDYFHKGPRSSALRMQFDVELVKVPDHEVCALAQGGLEEDKYTTAHTNVQMFMLQNDAKTISVEVPIWLLSNELNNYSDFFNSTEALTGHIDALRIENGQVWIWDYKPNAHRERYATTQTNFYAIMLSKRSGIPFDRFRCGYFDSKNAFVFKPIQPESLKERMLMPEMQIK